MFICGSDGLEFVGKFFVEDLFLELANGSFGAMAGKLNVGFGVGWDILYIALQQLRWDRDWPAAFQVANGVIEGILVYSVITTTGLPGIESGSATPELFTAHYGLVWLTTFVWTQGPMRVLFPRWRFFGGRIV